MIQRSFLIAGVLLAILAPLGCSNPDDGLKPDPNAGKSAAQRSQETVDAIKNNPHMTDQQKQAAMASMQGHQGAPSAPK